MPPPWVPFSPPNRRRLPWGFPLHGSSFPSSSASSSLSTAPPPLSPAPPPPPSLLSWHGAAVGVLPPPLLGPPPGPAPLHAAAARPPPPSSPARPEASAGASARRLGPGPSLARCSPTWARTRPRPYGLRVLHDSLLAAGPAPGRRRRGSSRFPSSLPLSPS